MSVVYLAQDTRLDRRIALKVMAEELSENESFRTRFVREAKLAANLEHPNIVPLYDAGEVDGVLYLAMRVIRGTDLRHVIDSERAIDPERAMAIGRQVASALDAAHRAGLVHRDVKPGNILLARDGDEEHAYLSDFGLTKQVSSDSGLTKTGTFMGTVDYVAPEQIRGIEVDGGDEVPVPNDFYIGNDNPKLRKLALAPDIEIVLIDWNTCCDVTIIVPVEIFAEAMESSFGEIDGQIFGGSGSPYHLTVEDGVVVRITEQFLP